MTIIREGTELIIINDDAFYYPPPLRSQLRRLIFWRYAAVFTAMIALIALLWGMSH